MTRALPLLAARDPAAPIAWRDGQPVGTAQFIAQAMALAETLPARGRPINLCQDRLLFALGLCAALLRGQTSLMPPNALPATLRALAADEPSTYAMVDDASLDLGGLRGLRIEARGDLPPATAMPTLPVDLDAVCLLTSGSTGPPQPHRKRWGALVANIAAEAERLAALMDRPSIAGLNVLATVPAQHSYGFESTVLLAMLGGAAFDAARPFYPADIAEALARLPRPRALVTTPFHLKTLLRAGVALPPVDLLLSATAPLSPQLAAEAEARLDGRVVEIYGCTEAGQVAARRTTQGETWTTLGALHLWREDGADGERFLVDGGHVPGPTPLADVLELLDPQHFRLLGRANDLIHVAGKRSSLAHLNFQLNRIEGVEDGAFWMPDDETDGVTRPVAFVVAPTLSAPQVVQALRACLEPAFVPRRVVHAAALPREATGKLTAAALSAFAQAQLGRPTAPAVEAPADFECHIAPDHPAFDGHFPGQPVLPGVVLLDLAVQALDRRPALRQRLGAALRVDHVKFLHPVGPGSHLRVTLHETASGVAFEVLHADRTVARGRFGGGHAP